MFGLTLRKKTPLEAVLARFTRLEGGFRKASRALGSKRPDGMARAMTGIRAWIPDVRTDGRALEVEVRRRRRPRESTIDLVSLGAEGLLSSTRSFERLVAVTYNGRSPMPRSLVTVHKDLLALTKAIRAFLAWVQACRARLGGEAGRIRRLFKIIQNLDSKMARSTSGHELAVWLNLHDVPHWEEEFQLRRLAKLFLAEAQPHQQWEVRWRSSAPGRPLILAMVDSRFPDDEYLGELETAIGYHDEYYIAAQLPRWRIVWKTSWNQR